MFSESVDDSTDSEGSWGTSSTRVGTKCLLLYLHWTNSSVSYHSDPTPERPEFGVDTLLDPITWGLDSLPFPRPSKLDHSTLHPHTPTPLSVGRTDPQTKNDKRHRGLFPYTPKCPLNLRVSTSGQPFLAQGLSLPPVMVSTTHRVGKD